jgi:hypothetical protein
VGALFNSIEAAIWGAKRAIETLPISTDSVDGPDIVIHVALVYAWTYERDLAFETLGPLTKTPKGIYYGDLQVSAYWEPLRKDPRFETLLAQLAQNLRYGCHISPGHDRTVPKHRTLRSRHARCR